MCHNNPTAPSPFSVSPLCEYVSHTFSRDKVGLDMEIPICCWNSQLPNKLRAHILFVRYPQGLVIGNVKYRERHEKSCAATPYRLTFLTLETLRYYFKIKKQVVSHLSLVSTFLHHNICIYTLHLQKKGGHYYFPVFLFVREPAKQ